MSLGVALIDVPVPRRERAARAAVAVGCVAGLLAAAGGTLAWLDRGTPHAFADAAPGQLVNGLAYAALGAVVVARGRRRMGWLLVGLGLCHLVGCVGQGYIDYGQLTRPGALPAAQWAVLPAMGWLPALVVTATALPLVFPTGRLPPRRSAAVLWLAGVGIALLAVGTVIDPASAPQGEHAPTVLAGGHAVAPVIDGAGATMVLSAIVLSLASVVRRLRRAGGVERDQLRWFAYGLSVLAITLVLQAFLPDHVDDVLEPLSFLLLPAAIAVAIFRHRLYDIDVVIARSVVYAGLTAGVVGGYAAVVGLLELVLHEHASFGVSLVASAAVALAFGPLRLRLQAAAERLVYGRRAEPYRVLADLGRRLEATADPDAVLPALVATLVETLRLPHAAIELQGPDGLEAVAAEGAPVGRPLDLPLVHHGVQVGRLLVSPRGKEESFSASERDLLADVARQAGVAAHAVRLTAGLQQSRMRLVTAREEERRRLRRDLHDGLGPTLAGVTLRLDAIRRRVAGEPDAVEAELLTLRRDVQAAIGDIRGLVYDLRPPALDELGLVPAITEGAQRLGGLRATVSAPEPLGPLPAAVEVAAFRIAQEALTNAARHARARACTVTLRRDPGGVAVEVADDGAGLPERRRGGVGLRSMRERAEELGGSLELLATAGGGTTVRAWLPVPR